MSEAIKVQVNGKQIAVPQGSTVAVAILLSEQAARTSVSGQSRVPFCGMGTCFECRVTIGGKRHRRGCQILCESQMEIATDE